MDAKLDFEVDVEVSTDMVDRGEERRGIVGWYEEGLISRRPSLRLL
jgi:hypothetical protein